MPPALEITKVDFIQANLHIATPTQPVVGANFRVQGSASVLMRLTEFIKQGGQGTKTVEEFFQSQGLTMSVIVNSVKHALVPEVQTDNTLRWHHDVTGGTPGQAFAITVKLSGSVEESEAKSQNGEITSSSTKQVGINRSDTLSVKVDSDPPELAILSVEVGKGPPYEVTVKGTAHDVGSAVATVHVRAEGGPEIVAQNLSGDFTAWRAAVTLADRVKPHTITVTAADALGNTSEEQVSVDPDLTPPLVAIVTPPSPHVPIFEPGGITVPVEGLAHDSHSRITAVKWQLDGGPVKNAEDLDEGFKIWRLEARIENAEDHVVTVTAIDGAGNVSAPAVLKIQPQI